MKKHFINNKIVCSLVLVIIAMALIASLVIVPNNKASEDINFIYNGQKIVMASGEFKNSNITNWQDVLNELQNIKEYGFKNIFEELKILRVSPSANGKIYQFEQYNQSIRVFGRRLAVSVDKNGKIQSISGNYLKDITIKECNIMPLDLAMDKFFEEFGEISKINQIEIYSIDCLPTMTYSFNSYDNSNQIFIDATTLETIAVIPLTKGYGGDKSTEQKKVEQIDYNGNKVNLPVEKVKNKEQYFLADASRNIFVYNAANNYEYKGTLYESQTGKFNDKVAISTFNMLIKSYDFYTKQDNIGISEGIWGADGSHDNVHGNAQEKKELSISALVHYGNKYNNAGYVTGLKEENPLNAMLIFGDGDGEKYGNFAASSYDIIGHEYQHVVTEYNAGFIYLNASGAINEAYSDIFGALIEGKDLADDDFWNIGEDLMLQNQPLRDIKNPFRLGLPDRVTSAFTQAFCFQNHMHLYCDNGGVHANSSIITHAAYEMYNMMPEYFTKQVMGTLWMDTLLNSFPDTTYEDFRVIMMQSAKNLNFTEEAIKTIAQAFDNVDIYSAENIDSVEITFFNYEYEVMGTTPGKYGDKFIAYFPNSPFYQSAPEGYETIAWICNKYGTPYYVGQKYKIPAYDMELYPRNVPKIWNNVKPTRFEGKGTQFEPYLIQSAADLATLAYTLNAKEEYQPQVYYKMTADIDLENKPWIPIGLTEQVPFNSYFDGDGHKITNLKLESKYGTDCGLFGVMSGEVKNLGIESGMTSGYARNLGAFAGILKGKINNCYNKSDIFNAYNIPNDSYPHKFPVQYIGGIAGTVWLGDIDNSYNTGAIQGQRAGGIFGSYKCWGDIDSNGLVVPSPKAFGNNYNTGNITGIIAGGIAGEAANSYLVNCINLGTILSYDYYDYEYKVPIIGGIVGKLNFSDEPIYHEKYDDYENAGIYGCKNVGEVVLSEIAIYYGAMRGGIAGLLTSEDTTGITYAEKNIYKAQNGLSAFGSQEDLSLAKESSDELYYGDFDFDNEQYFRDFEKWGILGDISIFDANVNWAFDDESMPIHKKEEYWLDNYADSFDAGNGSETAPYEIKTAQQLARLAYLTINSNGKQNYQYYKLTADIDLKGKIWVGIGGECISELKNGSGSVFDSYVGFSGVFDGQGFKIKNLSSRAYGYSVAPLREEYSQSTIYTLPSLFSATNTTSESKTIIKNINVENVNNIGDKIASGIIGIICDNNVEISACNVLSGAVSSNSLASGIIGEMEKGSRENSKILNCYNNASISGNIIGGIIANVKNSNIQGTLEINYCVNKGNLIIFSIEKFYVIPVAGGLIGLCNANTKISNSTSMGTISNFNYQVYVGGFIGLIKSNYSISTKKSEQLINISIDHSKQVGEYKNYGQQFLKGGIVGKVENKDSSAKIILDINNNIFKDKEIYSSDNSSGGGSIEYNEINNVTDAGDVNSVNFDFNNIEYYFNSKFWGDIDAEFANDMYEQMGNARIEFTVVYRNYDNSIFYTGKVRYKCNGNLINNPTKKNNEKYFYVFVGWDKSINSVTNNMVVVAQFEEKLNVFIVELINYDNIILQVFFVEYGGSLTEQIVAPSKNYTYYEYKFIGWDKPLNNITKDMQVRALYSNQATLKIKYKIIYIVLGLTFIVIVYLIYNNNKRNYYIRKR